MPSSDEALVHACRLLSWKTGVAVGAALCSLALAACSQTPASAISDDGATPASQAFTAEPYPIRIADRSKYARHLWPSQVVAPIDAPAGTILVDTDGKLLYLMTGDGRARRYGIGVGAAGYSWSGEATIGRKAEWPAWYPTVEMRSETPDLPARIEPGPHNPLGARALYLFDDGRDTLYRIHGTSEPWTIGTAASSGCIRMLNEDVIDLYDRVENGAMVIVR